MRRCPACTGPSKVYDTRETKDTVRRARECKVCGARWTTMEITHDEWVLMGSVQEMAERVIAKQSAKPRRVSPFGAPNLAALRKAGTKPPEGEP
jgi:transcriptional regulator NrdR family protein